jgi:hypothetical protein
MKQRRKREFESRNFMKMPIILGERWREYEHGLPHLLLSFSPPTTNE